MLELAKDNKTKNTVDFKVNVDRESVDDTLAELEEHYNELNIPNVTIRNNETVYLTMNNFNCTHEQYIKEEK